MSEIEPKTQTVAIAEEVARILKESTLSTNRPAYLDERWIGMSEAAKLFGYSTSRFYHVYKDLGLLPSRASRRKLRFRERDIMKTLSELQYKPVGRARKTLHQIRIEM